MTRESPLSRTLEFLIKEGEYKLAIRLLWNHRRILKLRKAKLKHNQRWAKTAKITKDLHSELELITFRVGLEVYSDHGISAEDVK